MWRRAEVLVRQCRRGWRWSSTRLEEEGDRERTNESGEPSPSNRPSSSTQRRLATVSRRPRARSRSSGDNPVNPRLPARRLSSRPKRTLSTKNRALTQTQRVRGLSFPGGVRRENGFRAGGANHRCPVRGLDEEVGEVGGSVGGSIWVRAVRVG